MDWTCTGTQGGIEILPVWCENTHARQVVLVFFSHYLDPRDSALVGDFTSVRARVASLDATTTTATIPASSD